MLEHEVEDTVVAKARMAGWKPRKVSWQGRRGAPDHVFFGFGRCVYIEFKAPGETLIGQQSREFKRLKEAYPEVYAVDNVAEGLRILGIENG